MDYEKALEEAQSAQRQLLEKANRLEQERQVIIEELLRLDGEIRVLRRLNDAPDASPAPK